MFKKSFQIVVIQLIGVLLSFCTIYFVAGDMGPEIYSLVGVYTVVSAILLTFSDLGFETTLMREALYWKEHGRNDKVCEYASQALMSRIMAFIVLAPVLLGYLGYINRSKYAGKYTQLFIVFYIGACLMAVSDSMALTIRAIGDYVFSAAVKTINPCIVKCLCIIIYFKFGAMAYLYIYALSALPMLGIFLIKLRNVLNISNFNVKEMWRKIWKAKFLWLRTDLDYFKGNADSLLVSVLFPSTVTGTYTIYKQIESILKGMADGFFDVLSQNTVKYKGNTEQMKLQEKKIKKARSVTVGLILLGVGIYMPFCRFWIIMVHLDKYEMIEYMLLCCLIVMLVYVWGKYEQNALAFLASPEENFVYAIVNFIVAVLSFGIVIPFPNYYGISLQRMIAYGGSSAIGILLFRSMREKLYKTVPEEVG